MKRKFEYYAVFKTAPEGGYCITFPDLPGAISEGDDYDDALYMARDCMITWLDDGVDAPRASSKEELERRVASDPDIVGDWRLVLIEAEI